MSVFGLIAFEVNFVPSSVVNLTIALLYAIIIHLLLKAVYRIVLKTSEVSFYIFLLKTKTNDM